MTEDKVKANITASGLEIEAQGGAASRIGHALADALSPFTQALGTAGDQIQLFRIHRLEKTLETLDRAKQIRDELGIEKRPVSKKFLTHWIEGASLESEGEDNVTELWATLLAKAPEEFSANHVLFVDVLGKLGSTEARVFQRIIEDHSGEGWDEFGVFESIGAFRSSPKRVIEISLREVFSEKVSIEKFVETIESIEKNIHIQLSLGGSGITEFHFYPCRNNEMENYQSIIRFDDGYYDLFGEETVLNSLDVLTYLGLIDHGIHRFDLGGFLKGSALSAFVSGASVTNFGAKFAIACIGSKKLQSPYQQVPT